MTDPFARRALAKHAFASALLTLAFSPEALAGDAGMATAGDIMIHESWARASIGNAPNSAAYMTVMTHGESGDKLVGAATPAAETAELHNHIMEEGIAKMRPVDVIEVMPDEPVTLGPGGLHIMLMGLKGELEAGDTFPLTLTFENAGEVKVDVPIKSLKDAMKQGSGHEHHAD